MNNDFPKILNLRMGEFQSFWIFIEAIEKCFDSADSRGILAEASFVGQGSTDNIPMARNIIE